MPVIFFFFLRRNMYRSINEEKKTLSINYAKAAKRAGIKKKLTRQKDIGLN
jgi:hypothetical protein